MVREYLGSWIRKNSEEKTLPLQFHLNSCESSYRRPRTILSDRIG